MIFHAINAVGVAIIVGKYLLFGLLAAVTITNAT